MYVYIISCLSFRDPLKVEVWHRGQHADDVLLGIAEIPLAVVYDQEKVALAVGLSSCAWLCLLQLHLITYWYLLTNHKIKVGGSTLDVTSRFFNSSWYLMNAVPTHRVCFFTSCRCRKGQIGHKTAASLNNFRRGRRDEVLLAYLTDSLVR